MTTLSISEARCTLLSILRPDWLEAVTVDHEAGELVIHTSDLATARAALGERECVAGWPVRIERVTPR